MIRAKHLVLAGVVCFLLFMLSLMPASSALRFAALPTAFSYQSVSGTLWNMELSGVSIYGRPVGTLSLEPGLSVLVGGLDGQVKLSGPDMAGEFDLAMGDQITVENLDLTMGLSGRVSSFAFDGAMRLQNGRIELQPSGRCLSAVGSVRTNAFADMFAALGMSRDAAAADLTCEKGYLQVNFNRRFGAGSLQVVGNIIEPSVLDMVLLLRFDDQAAIPQEMIGWLDVNGFEATSDGWRATLRARL